MLLVHEKVKTDIKARGLPLNAPKNATLPLACGASGPGKRGAQQGTHLPPTLVLPKGGFSHWVVGAFEGGGDFQCGVYHPTGACIMRLRIDDAFDDRVFTMCPVCRYIVIDKFDPTHHGAVDRWYQTRYPG
jgi:hypothetical protein